MPSNTKTVEVYHTDSYEGCMPDEKLTDVIAWFQEKLASVPEEYRDNAEVEFSSGDYSASIRITYERPETAEERAEEEKRDQANADRQKQIDLDTLRRLKAKYPDA